MATAKIEWRSSTPNKSLTRLLTLMKDFITDPNQGKYTLLVNDLANATTPSFAVTYNRGNPAFTGDNPVVVIQGLPNASPGPAFVVKAYENYTASPGVNASFRQTSNIVVSTVNDSDLWLTAAPTHLLFASRVVDGTAAGWYYAQGVCCIERLSGDEDQGTYYGVFTADTWASTKCIYVPKRWDGATNAAAVFMANTRLNGVDNRGLVGTDEAGKHVIFDINISRPEYGKLKGKLYGVAMSTYGYELAPGLLLPDSNNPQWLVTKPSTDMAMSILMNVSTPTILA